MTVPVRHRHLPAAVLAAWLTAAGAPALAQAAPPASAAEAGAQAEVTPAAPASSPASAASAPRPPSKGEQQALQWFRLLDADHDGRLSWGEVRSIPWKPLREEFHTADTDGDGHLTPDEIRVLARRRVAERRARKAREQAEAEARRQAGAAP